MVLPNLGGEQHAYLTHIFRNYDSLADWTVFMHGKTPTCGYSLVDPSQVGNHLLTNVSVLDFLAEGDLYMPLTGRANNAVRSFSRASSATTRSLGSGYSLSKSYCPC